MKNRTKPSAFFRPLPMIAVGLFCSAAIGDRCVAQQGSDEGQAKETQEYADPKRPSLSDPIKEVETPLDEYVTPEMVARKAFDPPPGAKMLSKNHLWVDTKKKRVYIDGYVAIRDAALEMFACPAGTKEHESLVGSLAKPRNVHAALLAVGAKPGTPVQFHPKFVPATGQQIRVWVTWLDQDGKFHHVDARDWIMKAKTKEAMRSEWVFAGSGFWEDDGKRFYRADAGDMICVSNFSSAMLDLNIASSAEADQLLYVPKTELIPERFTPLRLVLVPIPNPGQAGADSKEAKERLKPPTKEILPKQSK